MHRRPSFKSAFLRMAQCSLLFVVVYNLCNHITLLRSDVRTSYFPFELHLPFIPWMILPYWSLDAFFVGSFFLCRRKHTLNRLACQLALATVLGGLGFLLFPMTTAFPPTPTTTGFLGVLFRSLSAFDKPHNLFPSLHIAFSLILGVHYHHHVPWKVGRMLSTTWFFLIALSTVFTYQHHLVDVLGGMLLGSLCWHVCKTPVRRAGKPDNPSLAWRYALGAVLALCSALISWQRVHHPLMVWVWGLGWAWLGLALAWVAVGYGRLGPAIYHKKGGQLTGGTRLLMAPIRLGHWLSFLYYQRQGAPWNAIAPGVWVGRRLCDREAQALKDTHGLTAVVDLAAESSENAPFRALSYLSLPVLDLTAPTPRQLAAGVAFIQAHAPHGVVYIHCKIGYSRSAALAAAYLMSQGMSADDALAHLKHARPHIIIRPEIFQLLSVTGFH